MTRDRSWVADKACRAADAPLFWPSGGYEPGHKGGVAADYGPALVICARCPVVAACRADAEASGDIRGGYTTHGQVVGGCAPKPRVVYTAKRKAS